MSHRRLTLLLVGLPAVTALAACGPRVPAARPAPAPTTTRPSSPLPAAATPDAPVALPVAPGAAAWTVSWSPGFSEYVVTSQAAVHVEGDTLPPMDDSVATRAHFSMRVSPTSAPRGVVVTVDSFLVSPRRGAPMATVLANALAFQAQLDDARSRIDFLPEQSMLGQPCAGPAATLLAIARDLAPALPVPLERGRRWSETTTHTLCRSGVPLTIENRHEWSVDGEVQLAGRVLVRLRRETQATIVGAGTGRRAGATVEGTSRTTAEYLMDPGMGRLQWAATTSSAELRVRERPDALVLTSRQEARQEAVLVER